MTFYSNRTSPNMQRLQEAAKAEGNSKSVNPEVNAFGRLHLQESNPGATPCSFEARVLPGEVDQPQPH